jgi:hypothetical protein
MRPTLEKWCFYVSRLMLTPFSKLQAHRDSSPVIVAVLKNTAAREPEHRCKSTTPSTQRAFQLAMLDALRASQFSVAVRYC